MQRTIRQRKIATGVMSPDINEARFQAMVKNQINESVGVTVQVDAPAIADTEFAVLHPALGKKCTEAELVMQDKSGRLYRSGAQKWTHRVSFFKYDQDGGRLTIRLR